MKLTHEIITASATAMQTGGAHLFWTDKPSESLVNSINEFGQTTPVLVSESENGLTLVAGHARLAALTDSGAPVLARMVEDATSIDMGLLYLADNGERSVDDGMRLKALKYFSPLMDVKQLRSDILPRLGVKPKSKDAKLLLAWLAMDERWQELLIGGNVPLAVAPPLSRMSEDERAAVEPLFTGFSWSRSNAVNTLTWLFETAKMTDSSVNDIMEKAGIGDIMKQGLSPKDAIARLAAAAKLIRYPELSKLQEKFATAAREITGGTRWRMTQPNNFETGVSELTVQVKDAAQLANAVKEMEALAASSAWEKIWNLGSQDD